MKLNKLRTRFSYHKKSQSKRKEKIGRNSTCISLFLYKLFFFARKNVCWRLASAEEKQKKKIQKHENSLNENKLKSCREILTCRSRYSALSFLSSLLQLFSGF